MGREFTRMHANVCCSTPTLNLCASFEDLSSDRRGSADGSCGFCVLSRRRGAVQRFACIRVHSRPNQIPSDCDLRARPSREPSRLSASICVHPRLSSSRCEWLENRGKGGWHLLDPSPSKGKKPPRSRLKGRKQPIPKRLRPMAGLGFDVGQLWLLEHPLSRYILVGPASSIPPPKMPEVSRNR